MMIQKSNHYHYQYISTLLMHIKNVGTYELDFLYIQLWLLLKYFMFKKHSKRIDAFSPYRPPWFVYINVNRHMLMARRVAHNTPWHLNINKYEHFNMYNEFICITKYCIYSSFYSIFFWLFLIIIYNIRPLPII